MKPFSLDNVLAYRKRLADLAHQRFLEACNVHRQVELRLAEETLRFEELSKESERRQRQGMAIIDLIRFEERIMQVQANIAAIAKNLQEKALLVVKEQQQLARRVKEQQIMERLKERQNRAWAAYLEKKETATLDEIAILRYDNRKK
jgi:flagellar export protein FliJ